MITTARRLTAAAALTAALALAPAGIASAASSQAPDRAAEASGSVSAAASWTYYDWYYFKADCNDMGRWIATEPLADRYDYWKCVKRGSGIFGYYDLYVK